MLFQSNFEYNCVGERYSRDITSKVTPQSDFPKKHLIAVEKVPEMTTTTYPHKFGVDPRRLNLEDLEWYL